MERAITSGTSTAACDVIKGINPPKLRNGQRHRSLCRLGIRGVCGKAPRATAESLQRGVDIPLASAGDGDVSSLPDKCLGGGKSEARGATYDHHAELVDITMRTHSFKRLLAAQEISQR